MSTSSTTNDPSATSTYDRYEQMEDLYQKAKAFCVEGLRFSKQKEPTLWSFVCRAWFFYKAKESMQKALCLYKKGNTLEMSLSQLEACSKAEQLAHNKFSPNRIFGFMKILIEWAQVKHLLRLSTEEEKRLVRICYKILEYSRHEDNLALARCEMLKWPELLSQDEGVKLREELKVYIRNNQRRVTEEGFTFRVMAKACTATQQNGIFHDLKKRVIFSGIPTKTSVWY